MERSCKLLPSALEAEPVALTHLERENEESNPKLNGTKATWLPARAVLAWEGGAGARLPAGWALITGHCGLGRFLGFSLLPQAAASCLGSSDRKTHREHGGNPRARTEMKRKPFGCPGTDAGSALLTPGGQSPGGGGSQSSPVCSPAINGHSCHEPWRQKQRVCIAEGQRYGGKGENWKNIAVLPGFESWRWLGKASKPSVIPTTAEFFTFLRVFLLHSDLSVR